MYFPCARSRSLTWTPLCERSTTASRVIGGAALCIVVVTDELPFDPAQCVNVVEVIDHRRPQLSVIDQQISLLADEKVGVTPCLVSRVLNVP